MSCRFQHLSNQKTPCVDFGSRKWNLQTKIAPFPGRQGRNVTFSEGGGSTAAADCPFLWRLLFRRRKLKRAFTQFPLTQYCDILYLLSQQQQVVVVLPFGLWQRLPRNGIISARRAAQGVGTPAPVIGGLVPPPPLVTRRIPPNKQWFALCVPVHSNTWARFI